MATTITSSTFTNTYKDDYLDSDGYHKILFNSGVALQARELTQLQTILQNQIKRRYIFNTHLHLHQELQQLILFACRLVRQ